MVAMRRPAPTCVPCDMPGAKCTMPEVRAVTVDSSDGRGIISPETSSTDENSPWLTVVVFTPRVAARSSSSDISPLCARASWPSAASVSCEWSCFNSLCSCLQPQRADRQMAVMAVICRMPFFIVDAYCFPCKVTKSVCYYHMSPDVCNCVAYRLESSTRRHPLPGMAARTI